MDDNTTTTENEGTTQQQADGVAAADVRNHDLFLKLTAQLKEANDKLQEATNAQRAKEEERQRQELEAKGEYETITKQLQDKLKAMESQHSRELLQRDLTSALIKAGATNDTFIRGAVADYDGEATIDEYVEKLKTNESNAVLFGVVDTTPAAQTPPGTARPMSRSKQSNWAQVKADLRDPAKADAADAAVRDYLREHGEMPPGF